MSTTRKLLILSPPFTSAGGVSSYVLSLKGNWSVKEKYFFRGVKGHPCFRTVGWHGKAEYLGFFFTRLFHPGL